MPSAHLTLREEDVVRLTLEFLHNRELHISQLSVERETGVINGNYSDDVLFLRQLILDGQWDDVLEFIQPLEALQAFDVRRFSYAILRHKYIELLCIKSEAGIQGSSVDNAVEEVVKVLSDLEKFAPSKEEYSNLCLLLTLPRLTDHLQYKDWNPSSARVKCFREVYPLVEHFLPGDRKGSDTTIAAITSAKNDRLIQLIIKGILYESCVNYCQAKATGTKESQTQEMNFSRLLDGSVGFSDSDLSLLSWLQSIPSETFSVPFEQRTLNVDVERLERPSLETSWTEHMLITPIKPKTFPHSAMPFTRPRSAADIMSRSLLPALDGLSLSHGTGAVNGNPRLMALSTGDIGSNSPMTRSSFASFHLTGIKNNKLMNTSVDRLFENESDVFLSSSYAEFQQLPSIQEQTSTPKSTPPQQTQTLPNPRASSKSPERKVSTASTPEHRGRESPASVGTARSSRRDSLSERHPPAPVVNPLVLPQMQQLPLQQLTAPGALAAAAGDSGLLEQSFNGDLLKEFQRQKQKEREREELLKQLNHSHDNRLHDDSSNSKQGTIGKAANGRASPCPSQHSLGLQYRDIGNVNGTANTNDVHRSHFQGHQDNDPKGIPEGHYDTVKVMNPCLAYASQITYVTKKLAPLTAKGTMSTAINHAAAIKRLEALFTDVSLDKPLPKPAANPIANAIANPITKPVSVTPIIPTIAVEVEHTLDTKCDVHGKNGTRRGSLGNILHAGNKRDAGRGPGVGPRRESMPEVNVPGYYRRRDSLGIPAVPAHKHLEHPSGFAATLRQDPLSRSHSSLRRDSLSHSGLATWSTRRDSLGSSSSLAPPLTTRRNSNPRRYSTDSLDSRREWDRRGSSGSSGGWEDHIWEEKPVPRNSELDPNDNSSRPRFVAVTVLEDAQAVRCAEFHPGGQLYAVGSNSKTLRICGYPKLGDVRDDHVTYQPMVLFKRTKHHKGSIYCLAWSPIGDLMATGSNDKTVKLMRFNSDTSNLEGEEIELTMHDGTVRDLCFIEDTSNKSSLLISGGAGDCKIYVTDCATGTPFQALSGHSGHILSLYNWGGAMFVSGSQDKSVRFWDLRTRGCVNMVTPATVPGTRQGSPVASLCVDPSGRLLVSGHEDSSCVLYDIRGGRSVQCFKPHSSDVRSIRFSPSAYYLLTGGYDNKLVLTDLQGDLTMPLPSVVVAQHQDKVISGRWHPSEFSFLSTSADKTATLWALPPI